MTDTMQSPSSEEEEIMKSIEVTDAEAAMLERDPAPVRDVLCCAVVSDEPHFWGGEVVLESKGKKPAHDILRVRMTREFMDEARKGVNEMVEMRGQISDLRSELADRKALQASSEANWRKYCDQILSERDALLKANTARLAGQRDPMPGNLVTVRELP